MSLMKRKNKKRMNKNKNKNNIKNKKKQGMGPISCQVFLGAILPSVDSTTFWDKGRSILPMDDPSCQTEIEGNTDL